MTDLVLHQFASSPFSEKLRLVMGYKKLSYKSVTVPAIMPKPNVVALTGGYRRTPFLQIGADIYCDTALICDVLEHLQPAPSLYPPSVQAFASILAQWSDSTLFWSAVTYNRGAKGAGIQFGGTLVDPVAAIFEDRKAMGFNIDWWQPADAAPAYQSYVARLSSLLQNQPYLLGQQPCIADFCAYHPLWLVHVRATAAVDLLQHYPVVKDWVARMQAIGHSNFEYIDASQAIAIAAASDPVPIGQGPLPGRGFQDEHGIPLGSQVAVTPKSFGRESTIGELLAATESHYTLRRIDSRAGCVHVHFPRIGYVLKRQVP
jgi:glutathione S-transferase